MYRAACGGMMVRLPMESLTISRVGRFFIVDDDQEMSKKWMIYKEWKSY